MRAAIIWKKSMIGVRHAIGDNSSTPRDRTPQSCVEFDLILEEEDRPGRGAVSVYRYTIIGSLGDGIHAEHRAFVAQADAEGTILLSYPHPISYHQLLG